MKRILLSLLKCIICLSAFAQIDTSNKTNLENSGKWEIILVEGLKKGMGRLSLNFPDSAEWSVDIFNNQNKFIINRSPKTFSQKGYDLVAGIYNFKLNTVLVENVPIEEGKETRLKTGVHDINTPGHWELRSESKEKFLTSGNKLKKIALPVGKYQLKVAGSFRMIEIKDEIVIGEEPAHRDPGVLETEQWIANPMEGIRYNNTRSESGRLNLDFGSNVELSIYGLHIYRKSGGYQKSVNSSSDTKYLDLPAGIYRITWQGTEIRYEDVKILNGYETSLKHGVFKIITECSWVMGVGMTSRNGSGPKSFALPAGTGIAIWPVGDAYGTYIQYYGVTNGVVENSKVGYLNVSSSNFNILDLAGSTCVGYSSPRTVTLNPGKYKVNISGGIVTVVIKPGETVTL